MMRNSLKVLYTLLSAATVLLVVFAACKRETYDPYYGPQDCPDESLAYAGGGDFAMSVNAPSVVDFGSGGNLNLTATFNSAAPWKIVIKGKSSYATKVFEGFSSEVDVNWYGRPTGNVLFADEEVTIEFSVRCREQFTTTKNVEIIQGDYTNDPDVAMVGDADGNANLANWGFYPDSDPVYGAGEADTAICPITSKPGFCTHYTPSPQGGNCLSFIGTSPIPGGEQKNVYGTFEIYPPSLATFPSAPSDVWFNFYANSGGTPAKVIVSFAKASGGFVRFGKKTITIESSEWQRFSINLSEIERDPGAPDFTVQDIEIVSLTVAQMNLIAPTEFNVDLATFTANESFWGESLQE